MTCVNTHPTPTPTPHIAILIIPHTHHKQIRPLIHVNFTKKKQINLFQEPPPHFSPHSFMRKTQNQDSIPMTTHNSNHSINTKIATKTPSLDQETKKIQRVNYARPEPDRPLWQSEVKIKNRDSLSKKASKEEEEVEIASASAPTSVVEESGRERLKRHRVEVAGRVWIPDVWGQEDFLKDWIDCTVFDGSLGNNTIISARTALVEEGRRTANPGILRIENSC